MSLSRAGGNQNSESAGKEKNEEKKMVGRGNPAGEEIKRERGKDKRHLGRGRVKERAPGSKTYHIVFCIFSFPQRRSLSCHFIDRRAVTGCLPRGRRRSSDAAVPSLPSPVVSLVMDCFSLRYGSVSVFGGWSLIFRLAEVSALG